MFERLLVPTDGSGPAVEALKHAATIAAATAATGHVLHVTDEPADEPIAEHVVEEGRSWFEDVGATAIDAVRSGEPAAGILAYATENDVDAIVVGTHGREGVERFVLGSVAEAVVRDAAVPVLVVPPTEDGSIPFPYRKILVATNGSKQAAAALDRAIEVASWCDASVHVLSVVDVEPLGLDGRTDVRVDPFEAAALEVVERAADVARESGVEDVVTAVTVGSAHREIRSYAAEHGADLVVVGTRGRKGIDRLLLGSVTERVLRTASTPVLTVRTSDR